MSSSPSALLVAWSAPPSPGSPLTHYHLHLTPPPSPDSAHLVLLPSETQASLDGLRPSTQYTSVSPALPGPAGTATCAPIPSLQCPRAGREQHGPGTTVLPSHRTHAPASPPPPLSVPGVLHSTVSEGVLGQEDQQGPDLHTASGL